MILLLDKENSCLTLLTAPDPEKVLALGNCDYEFGTLSTFQSLKHNPQQ